MDFYRKFAVTALTFSFMLGACGAKPLTPRDEYDLWLKQLKTEMAARGISEKTLRKAFAQDYYHENPEVVKIDRRQPEFALTSTDYLNRVITAKRVEEARRRYRELLPFLKLLQKKYGVQPEYIIAFWGVETNFGRQFGNFEVINVLTTLSYDRRRPKFFREQLFQALQIMDKWSIEPEQMQGSWAGAMGHFQFMPGTFNAYAVDYNNDGKIDIWHSFEDAAASAANYLSSVGWRKNEPWGIVVTLPWNFDFNQAGRSRSKTIAEWQKLGIRALGKRKLNLPLDARASLILPEGKKGRAYLVMDNFRTIMKWNRSENYALAIGTLADYIKSEQKWQPTVDDPAVRVKTDDVLKIQAFINKLGWGKLEEDGQLGSQTRAAIQKVQSEARLPADGYPDYRLLQKINNYNPEIGFTVPVQPRKKTVK